jgi:hypothetical protein
MTSRKDVIPRTVSFSITIALGKLLADLPQIEAPSILSWNAPTNEILWTIMPCQYGKQMQNTSQNEMTAFRYRFFPTGSPAPVLVKGAFLSSNTRDICLCNTNRERASSREDLDIAQGQVCCAAIPVLQLQTVADKVIQHHASQTRRLCPYHVNAIQTTIPYISILPS